MSTSLTQDDVIAAVVESIADEFSLLNDEVSLDDTLSNLDFDDDSFGAVCAKVEARLGIALPIEEVAPTFTVRNLVNAALSELHIEELPEVHP